MGLVMVAALVVKATMATSAPQHWTMSTSISANGTCRYESDCPGNEFCDDGECDCGYLYALQPLCIGLTPESGWSIGSRCATLIMFFLCGYT